MIVRHFYHGGASFESPPIRAGRRQPAANTAQVELVMRVKYKGHFARGWGDVFG
jgi:hypothetical protein